MINPLDYAINLEIKRNGVVGAIDNVSATFLIKQCNDGSENSYDLNTLISKIPFKQGSIINFKNNSYLVLDIEQFNGIYYKGIIRKCESLKTALDNNYVTRHDVIGFVDKDKSEIVTTDYFLEENTYINVTIPLTQYEYEDTYIMYKGFGYMITNTDNTKEGLRIITAKKTGSPYSNVNSITLSATSGSNHIGDTVQLIPVCKEKGVIVQNPSVTYISSDETIAKVDNNGLINCIAIGSVKITCKFGDSTANYSLSVVQNDVYSIECDTNSIVLEKDKTTQLNPIVKLNGTVIESPILTYNVGDTSIVTCNNGLINGVGVGSTTIIINYEDKAQCTVNVTIKEAQITYTINGVNSFNQLDDEVFTISPLTNCNFYIGDFESQNIANIISDNGNGSCTVYGHSNLSNNYFTLYAKDSSGKVLASKEITILAQTSTYTLDLDTTSLSLDLDGTFTHQIIPVCKKNGVKIENPVLTYVSNSTSIANVNSSGLVTGIAKGSTSIKVTYRTLSKTININVINQQSIQVAFHLEASSTYTSFTKGQTIQFKLYKDSGELYPNNGDKFTAQLITNSSYTSYFGTPTISYTDSILISVPVLNSTDRVLPFNLKITNGTTGYISNQVFFTRLTTSTFSIPFKVDGTVVTNPIINLNVGEAKTVQIYGGILPYINSWIKESDNIVSVDNSKLSSTVRDTTITALKAGTAIIYYQCNANIGYLTINVV